MIRNTFVKKLLINTVFKGISKINPLIKKNDHLILFYTDGDFNDNNKYLYEYLIENHFNQKYTIICACRDHRKYSSKTPYNVEFISSIKAIYIYMHSVHVFYSFGKLPILPTKEQVVIQMWHGTQFKGFAENQIKTTNQSLNFYTYVYASSEYFVPIVEKEFQVSATNVVVCGHPRTDIFFKEIPTYDFSFYDKVIIWLPTFRKSKELGMIEGNEDSIIPIIKKSELNHLESVLEKFNVKLIIKLHPKQSFDGRFKKYRYLDFMTNETFDSEGYDLYALLRQADALITDYSSVFYDFLLLNRPIGFTEDDVKEYSNTRGFAVDPEIFRPGKRIRTYLELIEFITDISKNKDDHQAERRKINDIANCYQDGENCKRTLQFSNITK